MEVLTAATLSYCELQQELYHIVDKFLRCDVYMMSKIEFVDSEAFDNV
jgi:hypothetical protein